MFTQIPALKPTPVSLIAAGSAASFVVRNPGEELHFFGITKVRHACGTHRYYDDEFPTVAFILTASAWPLRVRTCPCPASFVLARCHCRRRATPRPRPSPSTVSHVARVKKQGLRPS